MNKLNYFALFWVSVFITIAVALSFLLIATRVSDLALKNIFISLGVNLIASAVFIVIYNFLSNKELISILLSALEKKLSENNTTITKEVIEIKESILNGNNQVKKEVALVMNQLHKKFVPIKEFTPSDKIDKYFNNFITNDISYSKEYFFRGISAKHVAIRLKESKKLEKVKVVMLNPNDDISIRLNATIKGRTPKYKNKPIEDIEKEIKKDIYKSIIALFDCKIPCDIEISFENSNSVYRLEIFDNALYLSAYYDKWVHYYPETHRYEPSAFIYDMFYQDIVKQFKHPKIIFSTKTNLDDKVLLKILEQDCGCKDINVGNISDYRKEYKKFEEDFIKQII